MILIPEIPIPETFIPVTFIPVTCIPDTQFRQTIGRGGSAQPRVASVWCILLLVVVGCGSDPPLAPAEQAAVEKIRALGGSVTVGTAGAKPTVQKVDLRRTSTTDADLVLLNDLPNVVQLRLARTDIGDEGLQHVATLANLQELYLGRTKVTDQGLQALENLAELRWISVSHTEITADGLKRLQQALPELKPVR